MAIVKRVQAILLKPKEDWVKIKAEPTTMAGLFTSYVMILAAIPAVFQFLRRIFIERLPVIGHWPVGKALGNAIVTYALALATVYIFALVINGLAPAFSSTRNMMKALKLAAYSMTPVWVAGILSIFIGLWVIDLLAVLYGFYILYLGFDTPMMETPKDKIPSYLAISILVAVGLNIVVNFFLKTIFAVRYGQL